MKKWIIIILVLFFAEGSYAAYQPIPIRSQGASKKAIVVDEEGIDKYNEIIIQLKILNEYMSRMTGEEITKSDLE